MRLTRLQLWHPCFRIIAPTRSLFAGLCGSLILGGCCPEAFYEVLTPDPEVRLPADEAPHCYGSEWWYYSGRLITDHEQAYGVFAVIFHVPHAPALSPIDGWMAHFAILDEAKGIFTYDQILLLEPSQCRAPADPGFDLSTALVQIAGGDGRDHLRAAMGDGSYAIDLLLEDVRGPVLHGADGYIPFGERGASFYYSRPRMPASGTLEINGQVHPAWGDFWFDRQWGRDLNNPWMGWDWFSLRLDGGADVMLFSFRESPSINHGTYIAEDGSPRSLSAGDFRIVPTAYWTSPHTGASYPVEWEITIMSEGLFLVVGAVADDQEIDARATTLNVYWEGLCTVTGTRGVQPVSGIAFAELTNYAR